MGNLEAWSSVMEQKMTRFDDVLDRLKNEISNIEKKEEALVKHKEHIIQEEIFRRRMQEELKIQEMTLQMKSNEYKKTNKTVNQERVNVKLNKLIITKLDGTSLDWFRFWNQFESEIDKAEIGPVSKFSYLKEFLESEITY